MMMILPLLLAATPDVPPRTLPSPEAAATMLADPATQRAAALAIAGLAGIVLDTRVGPLAAFADPADRVRPSDTVHDVVRRRDPAFDRHLYERSEAALATAGAVVGEAAEIKRTAARLQAALAPLLDAAGQ